MAHRRWPARLAAAAAVLFCAGCASGQQNVWIAGSPVFRQNLQPKVLVIGIDGVRPDAMQQADTPNIDALIADGAYSLTAQGEDLTFSGPNWSTILHGVHRDRHNVTTNDYRDNRLDEFPDFFFYLEQHNPRRLTARFTTWIQLHRNQPTGADINFFHNYEDDGDNIVTNAAALLLSGQDPDYGPLVDAVFVYLGDVDIVGHDHGFHPSVCEYLREIEDSDRQVGLLTTAIRNRPNYDNEDWLIILTSDHGGAIDGRHHGGTPEKRTIPFIVSGPSAIRGELFPQPRNVDVARTVLTHMGVPIDPAWSLDGHAVGLHRTERPPIEFGVNLIFNGDAEYDRGFNGYRPDQYTSGWDDPGPDMMTIVSYDAPGFPAFTDPGPKERGLNFLSGGLTERARITQQIDLSPFAETIDGDQVRYGLSAWLGGRDAEDDHTIVTARFRSADGTVLAEKSIGPVLASERDFRTGLLPRSSVGVVPIGTRSVEIELLAVRRAGAGNDGYADAVTFVLHPLAMPVELQR